MSMEDRERTEPSVVDQIGAGPEGDAENTRRQALKKVAKWTPPIMLTLIAPERANALPPSVRPPP